MNRFHCNVLSSSLLISLVSRWINILMHTHIYIHTHTHSHTCACTNAHYRLLTSGFNYVCTSTLTQQQFVIEMPIMHSLSVANIQIQIHS